MAAGGARWRSTAGARPNARHQGSAVPPAAQALLVAGEAIAVLLGLGRALVRRPGDPACRRSR